MSRHATTPTTGSAAAQLLAGRLEWIDAVVLEAWGELLQGFPVSAGIILDAKLGDDDARLWLMAHPAEEKSRS